MHHLTMLSAALVGVTLAVTTASAESLKKYGEVGAWGIWTNPVFANGCLMRGVFSGGTEVRAGIDARTGEGYMALFNDGWDVTPGQKADVTVTIDGNSYETTGVQLAEHGRQGGVAFSRNRQFFEDFANKQTMTIYRGGEPVTAIDLTGTQAAVRAVLDCQAAQG